MSSDEDAEVGEVHQSATAGQDAYVAGGNIIQNFYTPGTLPPSAPARLDQRHSSDDPWTRVARGHVAWRKAKASAGLDELRAATLAIIASLGRGTSPKMTRRGQATYQQLAAPI